LPAGDSWVAREHRSESRRVERSGACEYSAAVVVGSVSDDHVTDHAYRVNTWGHTPGPMLRVGLVGSGFMAGTHLDRYRGMDDARVTAVAAPNTAAGFVESNGLGGEVEPFADAETMLDAGVVDAVDVCSPTPTHRSVVEAAAGAGVDVLCEKPLALTLADARAIADAAADAGITLMVAHVLRFFPAYRAIERSIADGSVGEVGTVRARRVSPFPDWADWYADPDRSGGVFHDLAIHEFDFCRWVVGDVERVFARTHRGERHRRGHATLRFENGAVGYVEAGWDRPPGSDLESEFEAAGDEGLVEYDSTTGTPLTIETRDGGDDEADGSDPAPPAVERDGYRRELDAFVRAVRADEAPPVSVEDAIEAVRLSLAARRSAERGEPVAVAEVVA
jgi:predicted dehydrogenase